MSKNATSGLIIGGFAAGLTAGLTLMPLALGAQEASEDSGSAIYTAGSEPQGLPEDATALEQAVYEQLLETGTYIPNLEKYSSPQLAGILLTLTSEDPADRDAAIQTILTNGAYEIPDLSERTLSDMDDIRGVVEDSLARAGWSTDVSFLDDGQVIALFTEIAQAGDLDPQRIEELTENAG